MMRIVHFFAAFLMQALMVVSYLLGAVVFAYTVFVSYQLYGFIGALLAFIFPVASSFVLAFISWNIWGVFFNLITIGILVNASIYMGAIIFAALASATAPNGR